MTRREFLDYHYQVHGAIADSPEDPSLKPHKYYQQHVFDSAFGARPNGPLNANHHWTGRDDVTELWFKDLDHMLGNFRSEWVQKTVGPDGANFADLEMSINLMALEKPLPLSVGLKEADVVVDDAAGKHAITAMYWVALPGGEKNGAEAEKTLTPLLRNALEKSASDEVYKWLVNVGLTLEGFDPSAYFGGADLPKYALVYKIYMKDANSAIAVRNAQKAFQDEAGPVNVDIRASFIIFNKEVLVMDVAEGFRFDKTRQPVFKDTL
ncbi:Dimeric alpha-beta barrel [Macrophomina phaseolina MS6]|uniref:Dimeric alpha-beta barrel n=1 Tax=Macrophomina phaseolina (strain MS6) TaxID=1126212 RepID=K2RYB9_MACPH|nr:Dimeric alpha-beta barrel [Macrophomina phaseolina MS6]